MNEITIQQPREPMTSAQVMEAALRSDADPDKAGKLLALFQELQATEARRIFDQALADCQAEMPVVAKDRQITGRNKYASLEHIERTIRPVYQKHGFTPTYNTQNGPGENEMTVIATFAHRESGHREQRSIAVPFDPSGGKNGIQARGSAYSYGQRYLLCKFFNIIIAEEDTDGNAPQRLTDEQVLTLREMCQQTGGDPAKFAAIYGASAIEDIPASMYRAAVGVLKTKARAK